MFANTFHSHSQHRMFSLRSTSKLRSSNQKLSRLDWLLFLMSSIFVYITSLHKNVVSVYFDNVRVSGAAAWSFISETSFNLFLKVLVIMLNILWNLFNRICKSLLFCYCSTALIKIIVNVKQHGSSEKIVFHFWCDGAGSWGQTWEIWYKDWSLHISVHHVCDICE